MRALPILMGGAIALSLAGPALAQTSVVDPGLVHLVANADHPYANIDHRTDAGNGTGDAQVDQLNAAQLNQNYQGPFYPQGSNPGDMKSPDQMGKRPMGPPPGRMTGYDQQGYNHPGPGMGDRMRTMGPPPMGPPPGAMMGSMQPGYGPQGYGPPGYPRPGYGRPGYGPGPNGYPNQQAYGGQGSMNGQPMPDRFQRWGQAHNMPGNQMSAPNRQDDDDDVDD